MTKMGRKIEKVETASKLMTANGLRIMNVDETNNKNGRLVTT